MKVDSIGPLSLSFLLFFVLKGLNEPAVFQVHFHHLPANNGVDKRCVSSVAIRQSLVHGFSSRVLLGKTRRKPKGKLSRFKMKKA